MLLIDIVLTELTLLILWIPFMQKSLFQLPLLIIIIIIIHLVEIRQDLMETIREEVTIPRVLMEALLTKKIQIRLKMDGKRGLNM